MKEQRIDQGMTRDRRLVAWIAENVKGWKVMLRADWVRVGWPDVLVDCGEEGYFFAEKESSATTAFDPLTNPTDALAALDAWCDKYPNVREYDIRRRSELDRSVFVIDPREDRDGMPAFAEAWAPTVPRAIVAALCKVTGREEAPDA